MEWGGTDVRIGHWGYQNRFSDGNYSLRSSTDINGIVKTSVWLPQSDLTSVAFSLSASNGSVTGMALRLGGMTMTPVAFDDVSATRVELNAMQISDLMTSLSNQQGVLYHNSIAYVEVEIEAYGTGEITFSNLAVLPRDQHIGWRSNFTIGPDPKCDESMVDHLQPSRYHLLVKRSAPSE